MNGPRASKLLVHLAHRGAVLQCLEEGCHDSRKIAEEIDKSRSSVDRDIRKLERSGYIREHPTHYDLTKYGEFALRIYRQKEQIAEAESLIPELPASTPFELLEGAQIVKSGGMRPRQPHEHVETLIRTARELKIVTPVVSPPFTGVLTDRIPTESLTADIVIDGEVFDELYTKYDAVHGVLEDESCTVWQTSEQLTFCLIIADSNTVCLGVIDEAKRLLGTITHDSNTALEWAIGLFDERVERSEEVFRRSTTEREV